MEKEHIYTLVGLFGRLLSSPAQWRVGSGEVFAFVLVEEGALKKSKSALCFCLPLPDMSPGVH